MKESKLELGDRVLIIKGPRSTIGKTGKITQMIGIFVEVTISNNSSFPVAYRELGEVKKLYPNINPELFI